MAKVVHSFQRTRGYPKLARAAIERTQVPGRLAEQPAVVLERIARGAGATRWYLVERAEHLDLLAKELTPGSDLRFYFDGRIAEGTIDDDATKAILVIAAEAGDAVVAASTGGLELRVDFVSNRDELAVFVADVPTDARLFFGRFPGRDNDGVAAISMILPDNDGIVRGHPY